MEQQPPALHTEIIEKMSEHDWWYEYSDDNRAHWNGFVEHRELLRLFKRLSKHERDYFIEAVPASEREKFRAQVLSELAEE